MRMKHLKLFVAGAFSLLALAVQAQTMKDATDAYNSAVQLMATDRGAAIAEFEKCLDLCNTVGTEADSLKITVEAGLPGVCYDKAVELFNNKKYDEALAAFQKTEDVSKKYNNQATLDKINSNLTKLYFAIGYQAYTGGDLEKAITNLKKSTELDPENTKSWLVLGFVYRKKEDATNMTAAMDKAIAAGTADNDQKTVDQAKKVTSDFLLSLADKLRNKGDLDNSLSYLKKVLSYDANYSNAYYLQAVIFNKQSKWQEAVTAAKKAMETNGTADNAKSQYELGVAYMNLNDTGNACAAFKAAMVNKNYEQGCKYFIEQKLKCK